jgi:zinc protease
MDVMAVSKARLEPQSVRESFLDNGLRILVRPIHTTPLVSVWCWYRVGSRDEGPGRTGVSHWVEHMNFKGTTRIPRDEMKGIVERVGGMWNGYTWIDQTTYVETAGRDALDQLLFLEAERMSNGLYDSVECESERTVVISELQWGENDPDQCLDTEVTATAFRAHPYSHPTIGWIEDLRAMSRDDLYRHYRRFYIPNNATLVVVGDIDPDDVLRRAEHHFRDVPSSRDPERPTIVEPPQLGERRIVLERPGTAAYLKLAWHAPAALDPDFFPMLVLDAVLTGAKGVNLWSSFRGIPPQRKATLYTGLVERGVASSVSGTLLPTAEPFLYTISMTAMEGVSLPLLESAVWTEIDRVRTGGVSVAEVTRARRQLRARLVFENDGVTNIAHQLGYFATVTGGDFFETLNARIDAVTPEQVSEVARRRLDRDSCTVGLFQPVEQV